MSAALDMSHDWRDIPLPGNIQAAEDCFVESAQIFGMFRSHRKPGLVMGRGTGLYNQTQLIVGPDGFVSLGEFTCVNSTALQCESEIHIGAHCLLAWGAVISDCLPNHAVSRETQAQSLRSKRADGLPPITGEAMPVTLEDNVWVGFGAVVMPGVTIGQGSVIGARTVVEHDVPAFVVFAGSPGRIVKHFSPEQATESN
jgi:galactoside O-acetyltransferase